MKTVKIFIDGQLYSTVKTDSIEYVRQNVMMMYGSSGKVVEIQ